MKTALIIVILCILAYIFGGAFDNGQQKPGHRPRAPAKPKDKEPAPPWKP